MGRGPHGFLPVSPKTPVSPKMLPVHPRGQGPTSVQGKRASFLPQGACPSNPPRTMVLLSSALPHPFILFWHHNFLSLSLACSKFHHTRHSPLPGCSPLLWWSSLLFLLPLQYLSHSPAFLGLAPASPPAPPPGKQVSEAL